MEGVRGERFKYIRYFDKAKDRHNSVSLTASIRGEPAIYEELYDLKNDPHEKHNLADDPEYQDQLKRLRRQCQTMVQNAYGDDPPPTYVKNYAYEGFDYPGQGTLTQQSAGIGWFDHAWQANKRDAELSETGLTFTDGDQRLAGEGGAAVGKPDKQPVDVARTLGSVTGDVIWASCLLRVDSDEARSRLLLKDRAGRNFMYVELGETLSLKTSSSLGSLSAVAIDKPKVDQTYFVVLRYKRNDGDNNDKLDLWVNPSLTAANGAALNESAAGAAHLTAEAGEFAQPHRLRWQVLGPGGQGQLDEVRLGQSFGAVSPIVYDASAATAAVGP
jgi:hypothetical protein